jgi:hypothetical protein
MVRILLPPAASQANSDWPVVLREDKPGELLYLDTKKLGRIAGIEHRIAGRHLTDDEHATLIGCCSSPVRSGDLHWGARE